MTHETFCKSDPAEGHFLIDLFGLSKPHYQAVMLHYKLLKMQRPAISVHFVVPAVKHVFDKGNFKPAGILMQTMSADSQGQEKTTCAI